MTGLHLVIAFVFFSIVYAVQLYFSKSFLLKIFVITIFFMLSSVLYFSFETYKGWPTEQRPTEGVLVGAIVIEPNENDPGAIYLWVVSEPKESTIINSIITYRPKSAVTPRSYQLPYTKKFANSVQNAIEQMKNGFTVEISDVDEKNSGTDGSDNNNNSNKGKSDTTGNSESDMEYNVPHLNLIDPRSNGFKKG